MNVKSLFRNVLRTFVILEYSTVCTVVMPGMGKTIPSSPTSHIAITPQIIIVL